ncbi:MAG: DUF362 domain-containing protein [Verrucomicrobia bacterium]|nr:DUF362 domain-containing protein [Verrucomicrobiota bacterium]
MELEKRIMSTQNYTSAVSVRKVDKYDFAMVTAAVKACIEPFGGIRKFVSSGDVVLVKPNILGGFAPDRAVTTHPSIVRAVVLLAEAAGGRVLVGDSPGVGSLKHAATGAGIVEALKGTSAELVDLSEPAEFNENENAIAKKLVLAKKLRDIDVLISLPKLKTHAQMVMTGALKNQFGLVPGMLKSEWHFRLREREWFGALMVDINRVCKPALAIMDAVVAMEGKGPSGGRPRFVGALIGGEDLAAIDTVGCRLMGLPPEMVPASAAAKKWRYGETDSAKIEILGEELNRLCVSDFKNIDKVVDLLRLIPAPVGAMRLLGDMWTPYPEINVEKCIKCGICREGCPVSPPAIDPEDQYGVSVDKKRCIKCFCCHEFCPESAIDLNRPWFVGRLSLMRLAEKVGGLLYGRGR